MLLSLRRTKKTSIVEIFFVCCSPFFFFFFSFSSSIASLAPKKIESFPSKQLAQYSYSLQSGAPRRESMLSRATHNRGGLASTSNSLSNPSSICFLSSIKGRRAFFLRPPPLRLLLSPKGITADPASPPKASLWDSARSLFGDSGDNEAKEAKETEQQQEEDFTLLDPSSLPALGLPEAVISKTFLYGRPLAIAYVASRHGWSALSFHEWCDFKGPSLVVAETTE